MPKLSVTLFGKFSIRRDEQALSGFDSCKVQELFCYLLLRRERPHPRETLASLLWGDIPTPQSKKYLRQTLWQLQAALDCEDQSDADRVLLVENDWVCFNSRACLMLDVAVFEQAFADCKGMPGERIDARTAQALEEAVRLYEADLLEGWYQDWCLYERERLQNIYLAMLDKLMSYCEARGSYETGLMYGARIIRYDRARERTHRQMMRLQYMAGDRTAALRQYERCASALEEELGVKPDKLTQALYQQIRMDRLSEAAPSETGAASAGEPSPASLPELLNRLKHLRAVLIDIQRQIQQDIRAVELTLDSDR